MASSLASPVDRDGRSALPFPAPPTHGFSAMLLSVTDSPPVEDFVLCFSLDPPMIGSFIMRQSMDNPVEFLHQENLNFFPVQLGRFLAKPFHGIESLNACFSCYAGEHDVNTWVLPIERPLGPGANSSAGFAATFLWLDSGCTHHVVCDYRLLVNCRAPPAGKNVRIADGSLMPVRAVGTINIPGFCIPEVYFVPGAALNLISPGQLAVDHKINSALDAVSCILWTGQRIDLVGEGIRDERHGLYRLTFLVVP